VGTTEEVVPIGTWSNPPGGLVVVVIVIVVVIVVVEVKNVVTIVCRTRCGGLVVAKR
jgi:hypothetical protein